MQKPTRRVYVLTVRLVSRTGKAPEVRTLCGDTIFCRLDEGMSASWTLRRERPKPKTRAA
jgi:hypothetical protein